MWKLLRDGLPVVGWSPGKALEYLLLRAFEIEGAEVEWPYSVRDEIAGGVLEQIDGVVYCDGLACLIEAKDVATALNVEPLAKLRNQLMRRPSIAIGAVFSRSGYTQPALTLARFLAPQTILLWEADDIDVALPSSGMRRGLRVKFRSAIQSGEFHYALAAEVIP